MSGREAILDYLIQKVPVGDEVTAVDVKQRTNAGSSQEVEQVAGGAGCYSDPEERVRTRLIIDMVYTHQSAPSPEVCNSKCLWFSGSFGRMVCKYRFTKEE